MDASRQLHAQAVPPQERPHGIQWTRGWWARQLVWMLRRRDNLLPLLGIKPMFVQPTPQTLHWLRYPGSLYFWYIPIYLPPVYL